MQISNRENHSRLLHSQCLCVEEFSKGVVEETSGLLAAEERLTALVVADASTTRSAVNGSETMRRRDATEGSRLAERGKLQLLDER